MPTSNVIQPLLNPVKFIEYDPVLLPQYLSRHMDDFFYMETIKPWQQHRQYLQPWQNSDSIRLQFISQVGPMKISVIDIDERVYLSSNLQQLQQSYDDPTYYIYQGDLALSAYTEGLYFLKLECGSLQGGNYPLVLISEPLHIATKQKETVYLEYSHPGYYGGVIFGTGFSPSLRIRAALRLKSLSSKDTFFEDQVLDMTMLKAKPFRVFELSVGGPSGIPDYLADILNRVLGCATLSIDGKLYTKADGAKLEDSAAANYPMRSWSIDLREAVNTESKIYSTTGQGAGFTTIATVDGHGFGINGQGGSEEQILEFI